MHASHIGSVGTRARSSVRACASATPTLWSVQILNMNFPAWSACADKHLDSVTEVGVAGKRIIRFQLACLTRIAARYFDCMHVS